MPASLVRFTLVLFGAYGLAHLAGWARRQVLRRYGCPTPRRGTTLSTSLSTAAVTMPGPGGSTLRGVLLRGREPATGAALVLHGWGSSALDLLPVAAPLQDCGLDVLLLDARGHGRSDDIEFMSMPRFAEDAVAGLRWLRARGEGHPRPLVLVGHSVGAGACLLAAHSEPDVTAVVSLSAMADPQAKMRQLLTSAGVPRTLRAPMLRAVEHLIGQRFHSFAPLRTLPGLPMPVLLVHGEDDAVVPVADARQLAAVAAGVQLLVLPGTGHSDLGAVPMLGDALRTFLADPARPVARADVDTIERTE